ncbi:MAG TPA: AbrB/MazE/SpoVT family DNA-binding domain-containing protein [Candidatus Desulfaltia sp.]|nr:AbrB/MazE/SpoVT family DNA-binding domain-containing protein [Candidatus Desulfaltia sp.]
MTVATVSSKSQITLPAAACRTVGIKPRDRVLIEVKEGEIVVRPAPDIMSFEGFLGKALPREKEKEAMAGFIMEERKKHE